MKNQELAKIFFEMADYLEIDGVSFKPFAYRKVAIFLDNFKKDIGEIYKNGGVKALQEIPGIGEGIAKGIEEYLKKGKIKQLEELRKKHGKELEDWWKERFAHTFDCLTQSEARYILKTENADRVRNKIAEAEQEGNWRCSEKKV